MNFSLEGKVAIVTGAASGIGEAISRRLRGAGARVLDADLNAPPQMGPAETHDFRRSDCSQPEELAALCQTCMDRFGQLDIMVNNAGIATSEEHDEYGFAEWERMFAVNVDGPFLTTWAVKDEMIDRRFGRIVNISSLAAILIIFANLTFTNIFTMKKLIIPIL